MTPDHGARHGNTLASNPPQGRLSEAAVSVQALCSGYKESYVIRDANFDVHPREIFVILGKNGMGKTTLLKTMMGFLANREGRVELLGTDVSTWQPHRVASLGVSYVPQDRAIFHDLTVLENFRLAMLGRTDFHERLDAVAEWFPFLKERLWQKAGTLSGGQQKMLLISRALMTKPRLLLVDEITEGLQPSMIDRLLMVLRAENQERGVTMILVEQNVNFGLSVGHRYAVLNLGTVVESGLTSDPQARARIEKHLLLGAANGGAKSDGGVDGQPMA